MKRFTTQDEDIIFKANTKPPYKVQPIIFMKLFLQPPKSPFIQLIYFNLFVSETLHKLFKNQSLFRVRKPPHKSPQFSTVFLIFIQFNSFPQYGLNLTVHKNILFSVWFSQQTFRQFCKSKEFVVLKSTIQEFLWDLYSQNYLQDLLCNHRMILFYEKLTISTLLNKFRKLSHLRTYFIKLSKIYNNDNVIPDNQDLKFIMRRRRYDTNNKHERYNIGNYLKNIEMLKFQISTKPIIRKDKKLIRREVSLYYHCFDSK